MKKAIAITGTEGSVPNTAGLSTQALMNLVGNNCGNLMFQFAASNIFVNDQIVNVRDLGWKVGQVRKVARLVVVPAANFIRENFDLTGMTGFIERVDLPVVVLGLGAQAADFQSTEFNFHPSVERFVKVVAERSALISVRGDFTASVLNSFGVQNIAVTGCPSNFVSPETHLGRSIATKHQRGLQSFITHLDEPWPQDKAKAEVGRRLAHWTHRAPAFLVQQAVPAMLSYLRRGNTNAEHDMTGDENFAESLRIAMLPDASPEEFEAFLAAQVRTYYSVHQWMEDSAKVGFSIGMRLHGNMAAWQTGTPALWIYHDARTRELVETMALPHLSIAEFLETCPTIDAARERWEFDAAAYDKRRAELRDRLDQVLIAAGLTPAPWERPTDADPDAVAEEGEAASPPPAEAVAVKDPEPPTKAPGAVV